MQTPDRRTARAQSHLKTIRIGVRSNRSIAAVLGVSHSQVSRWKQGQRPDRDNADHLAGLALVVEMLLRWLDADIIEEWLTGANAHLERGHAVILHPAKPVGGGRRSGGSDEDRCLRLSGRRCALPAACRNRLPPPALAAIHPPAGADLAPFLARLSLGPRRERGKPVFAVPYPADHWSGTLRPAGWPVLPYSTWPNRRNTRLRRPSIPGVTVRFAPDPTSCGPDVHSHWSRVQMAPEMASDLADLCQPRRARPTWIERRPGRLTSSASDPGHRGVGVGQRAPRPAMVVQLPGGLARHRPLHGPDDGGHPLRQPRGAIGGEPGASGGGRGARYAGSDLRP